MSDFYVLYQHPRKSGFIITKSNSKTASHIIYLTPKQQLWNCLKFNVASCAEETSCAEEITLSHVQVHYHANCVHEAQKSW